MVRERLSCLGGHYAPAASFKQNDTCIRLDVTDPLACRRQCEVCLSGPRCNAASIDHANEQTQIREIQSHMLARGAFMIDRLGVSLLAVVPALAGMWLGSMVRQKISPKTFRRCFLYSSSSWVLELALHPFA
ncbi:hypothetical protein QF002_002824 [Paraburkholderia youngii]